MNHAHSTTAPTEGGLDDEGEADLGGDFQGIGAIADGLFGSGQGGTLKFLGQSASGDFIAHEFE